MKTGWLLPAAALALAAGILIGRAAETLWPLLLLLPCALGACLLLKDRGRFCAVQAAVLAVGAMLGFAAYHPALLSEGDYTVSGVVAEEIRQRDNGQVRTVLRGVTVNGQRQLSGMYWSFYLDEDESLPEGLVPGCRVSFSGRIYHPSPADNPGGYDFREYLLQKNVTLGAYGRDELTVGAGFHPLGLAAALRHRLSALLMNAMGQEAGGYAATMLLSAQDRIPEEDREAFSRLGVAHILSVSGFHVALLAGILTRIMQRLRLSRKLRYGVTLAILAAYCLLTGLNAPVIRAALLWSLYELGALKHRQRSSLHLLAASWIIQLVVSPAQLTSLSFQLTYGAMLGLTLVAPWLKSLWSPKRGGKVWSAFCQAAGAQVGILLPELYWFHELPLLGVILNMAVISLAAGLMLLCWITFVLLPIGPLAALAGKAAALILQGMLFIIRGLGSLPGVTLWVRQADLLTALGWLLLMLGMSWWIAHDRRRPALILGTAVLALSLFPWPHTGTAYLQFSVGEADAALLHDGQTAIAIDTGEDGQALAGYLHQRRIGLDGLVLTHLHADHALGITALTDQRIPVKTCYIPFGGLDADVDEAVANALNALTAAGTQIVELSRGSVIPLPSGSMTVLWPEFGKVRPEQEANLYSLALLADVKGTALLLTGDLDGRYEMYAAHPADVLKVAHHGSKSSTSEAFLQAVSPQLLLLSSGNADRAAAMEERRGVIPMADTGQSGALTLKFEESGFTLHTMR